MWELDYKESWVPKNWCFWTVVLEKTLKSPLDSKEIHPKGNQSWIFIGRTDVEAETPILWPLMQRADSFEKTWCWERLRAGGEGDDRGWDGCMASSTRWAWVWVDSGVGDGQGGLSCCGSWGHKESDTTEWLNWTETEAGDGTIQCGCPTSLAIIFPCHAWATWITLPFSYAFKIIYMSLVLLTLIQQVFLNISSTSDSF